MLEFAENTSFIHYTLKCYIYNVYVSIRIFKSRRLAWGLCQEHTQKLSEKKNLQYLDSKWGFILLHIVLFFYPWFLKKKMIIRLGWL